MSSNCSAIPSSHLSDVTTQTDHWRLSVAPMIDVTDRHCRFFHRQLAPRARLYTEMITTGALLHGDSARHLSFNTQEHPVALQLGGSCADDLARCARMGEQWGYDEINLNCGCPSDRVQKGAFGACLMADPKRVADCMKAMLDTVSVPVTVKHRLGLDYNEEYGFVRDFVGTLYDAGVRVFIVHARNAVLQGLSPRDNRQIPPLRYQTAAQLKHDFPEAVIVLNGGINQPQDALDWMQKLDGVMVGRAAWHTPAMLSALHRLYWPDHHIASEKDILDRMIVYAQAQIQAGVPLRFIARAMLGWPSGQAGARQWRRTLSDSSALSKNDPQLLQQAWDSLVNSQTHGYIDGDASSGSLGQSRI